MLSVLINKDLISVNYLIGIKLINLIYYNGNTYI